MKGEREFLDGMWGIVGQIEYEETQKHIVKLRNKQIVRKNIEAYVLMAVIFAVVVAAVLFVEWLTAYSAVYFISLLILVLAYKAESFLDSFLAGERTTKGRNYYEN